MGSNAHDAAVDNPVEQVPPRILRRAIAASAIGNATEWFDYGVYAYVAIEIGKNFFPGSHATLGALLVFAVSFVLRPLGGLVWGPLGDRLGRQRVLATTILLMCSATFLVGLIPSYGTIGIWAPVILIILRVIQGFSTGGEYGGAATFMAEYAPDKKRGFWGSFLEFGTLSGFTAAVIIVTIIRAIVGTGAMTAWGWRIPFLVAAPLGAIGLYLRLKMEDTPVFRELEQTHQVEENVKTEFKDLLRGYWKPLLTLAGLVIVLNVTNYTLLAYMPTYLQDTIHLSSGQTDTLVIVGQVIMMMVIPFAGALSDRIGRKPCWWISIGGLFVLAAPMFALMSAGLAPAVVAFTVLGLIYLLQLGTISATFPAMFPTHVRYAGFAIAYNIATAAFGGTAPVVNNALISMTGNRLMPAYYMMAACIVGAVALLFVRETAGASLRGRVTPGTVRLPEARPPTGVHAAPGTAA
jgi:MHS family proline/betaine transporter-like MFS transporter